MTEHLYRHGAKRREERKFEERYGKEHGDYVYGAVVSKVKKEREAKKADPPPRRRRRSPSVFDESYWTG